MAGHAGSGELAGRGAGLGGALTDLGLGQGDLLPDQRRQVGRDGAEHLADRPVVGLGALAGRRPVTGLVGHRTSQAGSDSVRARRCGGRLVGVERLHRQRVGRGRRDDRTARTSAWRRPRWPPVMCELVLGDASAVRPRVRRPATSPPTAASARNIPGRCRANREVSVSRSAGSWSSSHPAALRAREET